MQTTIRSVASAEGRALTALPATMLKPGHSLKSSVASGPPSGSSCTHGLAPANSPCTACTAQARGSVLSSACGPHRAQRSGACGIQGTELRDTGSRVQRVTQCRRGLRWPTEAQHALIPRFTPADSRITQRRSSRPSTTLLPWSPSTGTGGRHRSEKVVAINRIHRSPCPGARTLASRTQTRNDHGPSWAQPSVRCRSSGGLV
jgi:hypothetical protein